MQPLMPLAQLAVGEQQCAQVDGQQLLLCRTENGVYALENRCPHAGFPLQGGLLKDGIIRCPVHGARFKLNDGSPIAGRLNNVRTFPVEIIDEQICVLLNP